MSAFAWETKGANSIGMASIIRLFLYQALRIELAAHAAAEERFLYAPILMDDMGLDPSRHALSEHHEIDECVEELGKADVTGDSGVEKAKKLSITSAGRSRFVILLFYILSFDKLMVFASPAIALGKMTSPFQ